MQYMVQNKSNGKTYDEFVTCSFIFGKPINKFNIIEYNFDDFWVFLRLSGYIFTKLIVKSERKDF